MIWTDRTCSARHPLGTVCAATPSPPRARVRRLVRTIPWLSPSSTPLRVTPEYLLKLVITGITSNRTSCRRLLCAGRDGGGPRPADRRARGSGNKQSSLELGGETGAISADLGRHDVTRTYLRSAPNNDWLARKTRTDRMSRCNGLSGRFGELQNYRRTFYLDAAGCHPQRGTLLISTDPYR